MTLDEIIRIALKRDTLTGATLTLQASKAIVAGVFELLAAEVKRGDRIHVPGFGVFRLSERKARRIRSPKTKELEMLPPMAIIHFTPSARHRLKR